MATGTKKGEEEMAEWVMRVAREKADSEHHRLPQFYLRGFAGKQGRLKLLDPTTGETRSEAPKNTFVEEGYSRLRTSSCSVLP